MPDDVFKNIDVKNKVVPVPKPDKINDIDTNNILYKNIIDASENSVLDLTSLNSFTSISQSRDQLYNMLDIMCEDPIINAAVNIYTADACEPNEEGNIVWAVSDDQKVLGMVNHLLERINVNKNSFYWVNSLIKYGDLYLRLYRESEYNDPIFGDKKKENLNEDIIIKAYKPQDHYAEYMELHKNPAELFDLQRFGKTVGYIRTNIVPVNQTNNDLINGYKGMFNNYQYNFKQGDVDLYQSTEFVHACLQDSSSRTTEEVTITNDDENAIKYQVKRGQSILYNVFRIWRELSLLENSVMLNRITRSSIIRTVSVEVGDMEKNDISNLLHRIKSMVEQKSSISVGNSFEDYTNPGPIENIIYIPTHEGKGAITTDQIGGAVEGGDLNDLGYFKNKLNAGLGIPGAFLGEGDADGSLFNNGNSLALKSSIYAKTVKRIQNAYIQAITDAINLMLLDKGLNDYIGEFTIKMQTPTTQEEKDRKENLSNTINNIREIMGLLDPLEDNVAKLNILRSLLSSTISNEEVISIIQGEIDKLDAGEESEGEGGLVDQLEDEFAGEGGDLNDADLGDLGDESAGEMELPEPPEESFYNGEGELLNEDDSTKLPSYDDLGISYNQIQVKNN